MPILNYTTEVAAEKSVGEITGLLVRKGARSITQEYFDDGRVKAVSFIMVVEEIPTRFVLPANTEGVAGVMLKEKPYNWGRHKGSIDQYKKAMRERAEKVAWRILKDWVEAQMALIESGQAQPAQVFLPYVTERNGRTMYELFIDNRQQLRLGNGEVAKVDEE